MAAVAMGAVTPVLIASPELAGVRVAHETQETRTNPSARQRAMQQYVRISQSRSVV